MTILLGHDYDDFSKEQKKYKENEDKQILIFIPQHLEKPFF